MSEPIRKVLTAVRAESPFPKDFYGVFHATGIPPLVAIKRHYLNWLCFSEPEATFIFYTMVQISQI